MKGFRKYLVGLALASLWACGSPEQATVDQFFRAAQTHDSPTLAAMSDAGPPGEVESWEVVEIMSRTTEPFVLPGLLEKFEVAEKERNDAMEERQQYTKDNEEALARIIPKLREDPDYEFRGATGEVQEEWMNLIEERRVKEAAYQELRREVLMATRLSTKSVARQVPIEEFDGTVAVTEMLLDITSPEGVKNPYKVTLHKYELSGPESDQVERSRWFIADIEGTTPEARAAAAAAARPHLGSSDADEESAPAETSEARAGAPASSEAAAEAPAASEAEAEESARAGAASRARELRGEARVQILAPETKVVGNEVVSTLRVRNASDGWIPRFTVTEYWFDEQGNATGNSSRTHEGRFMPGEVIELELRTAKNPKFYQNQFEFSHPNGDVDARTVSSFPKS